MDLLLMPPLSCFLLGGAGVLLLRRAKRTGRALIALALAFLLLASIPLFAALALRSLQSYPALASFDPQCQAIVVLAGDANLEAPEYESGATCGPMTLERVRYAAHLARATKLPLLVSGGPPRKGVRAHAEMMKEALERDFGLEVRWVEPFSGNTAQNAKQSARILREAGLRRAYVVTHAWHMPRAMAAFAANEFEAVAAPTAFRAAPLLEWSTFAPSAKAMRETTWALHEWLGRAWYTLSL